MSCSRQFDRRRFLRQALAAALPCAAGTSVWRAAQSAPTATGDYKAMVCISLKGGNDGYNMLLATDDPSWSVYAALRQQGQGIGLAPPGQAAQASSTHLPDRLGGVLPLSPLSGAQAHRQVALHPSMPATRDLYESGHLAFVANVGPLIQPLQQADWGDVMKPKPPKLFAHADQWTTWQTLGPEGTPLGWGGQLLDQLVAGDRQQRQANADASLMLRAMSCMAPGSYAPWLHAEHLNPYYCSNQDAIQTWVMWGNRDFYNGLTEVMTSNAEQHLLVQAYQDISARGLHAAQLIGARLPGVDNSPWGTPGQTEPRSDPLLQYTSPQSGQLRPNALALQLQMVARLMEANLSGGMGLRRQCFHVELGGFDHHDGQNIWQAELLAQLDHALAYFFDVLKHMPSGDLSQQVTTFTMSEFGRTFASNGNGTDHGWGNHQLIMGGAVQGRTVYGRLPTYGRPSQATPYYDSPDQLHSGVMLPSTSVEQVAATLGRWMGASDAMLQGLLPNLARFPSAQRDLGFMG